MQMHVCIMSSLLQQVEEESIGLFISGVRPARNAGRALLAPTSCPRAPCGAGRDFFVLFLLFEHKMVAQFFVLFIAGWWQTYAASLRLHPRRRRRAAAADRCCRLRRWP